MFQEHVILGLVQWIFWTQFWTRMDLVQVVVDGQALIEDLITKLQRALA